jgi:uncharacterized membrane protein
MKTSIFDKIAVILAWVLVHVIIGIASTYIFGLCTNNIAYYSVFIAFVCVHYKWASKMVEETKKTFGFEE